MLKIIIEEDEYNFKEEVEKLRKEIRKEISDLIEQVINLAKNNTNDTEVTWYANDRTDTIEFEFDNPNDKKLFVNKAGRLLKSNSIGLDKFNDSFNNCVEYNFLVNKMSGHIFFNSYLKGENFVTIQGDIYSGGIENYVQNKNRESGTKSIIDFNKAHVKDYKIIIPIVNESGKQIETAGCDIWGGSSIGIYINVGHRGETIYRKEYENISDKIITKSIGRPASVANVTRKEFIKEFIEQANASKIQDALTKDSELEINGSLDQELCNEMVMNFAENHLDCIDDFDIEE